MAEARILSKLQLPRFEPGGQVTVRTQITYIVGIQPPRTIYIDKAEPSEDEIAAAIRKDQAEPPSTGAGVIQF